jgi:hypothetical protein
VLPLFAIPFTTGAGDPKLMPSIWNCTAPVAELDDSVAVKLTASPNVEGLGLDAAVTVVDALWIVMFAGALGAESK